MEHKQLLVEAVHVLGRREAWASYDIPPELSNDVLAEIGRRGLVIARIVPSGPIPSIGRLVAEFKAPPDAHFDAVEAKGWHSPSTAAEWLWLRKLRVGVIERSGPNPFTRPVVVATKPLCVLRLTLKGQAVRRGGVDVLEAMFDDREAKPRQPRKPRRDSNAIVKAGKAIEWLLRSHPEFGAFAKDSNTPTRNAWRFLREHQPERYCPPTNFDTFARYVREARGPESPSSRLKGDSLGAEMAGIKRSSDV